MFMQFLYFNVPLLSLCYSVYISEIKCVLLTPPTLFPLSNPPSCIVIASLAGCLRISLVPACTEIHVVHVSGQLANKLLNIRDAI